MTIVERIQKRIDGGYYAAGVFADLKTPLVQWITTFYFKNLITVVLESLQKIYLPICFSHIAH